MERMTKIGMVGVALIMLAACGKGIPSYDATGTFEATEVIVSAEAAGKLLRLEVEEGTRLKAGEEIGLGGYGAIVFEEITTGGQYEICGKPTSGSC